jgi:exonuclease-1
LVYTWLPQTVAKGIAQGNIDPITKEPFEGKTESSALAFDKVHLNRESSAPSNGKKKLDLPVQRNVLTNYFCILSTHFNLIERTIYIPINFII